MKGQNLEEGISTIYDSDQKREILALGQEKFKKNKSFYKEPLQIYIDATPDNGPHLLLSWSFVRRQIVVVKKYIKTFVRNSQ